MGKHLGVEFDLSYYDKTFTSELEHLGIEESHQLHEVFSSNELLEQHIETLSTGQLESSDLQDQLTSDGVFVSMATKLKAHGLTPTITPRSIRKWVIDWILC